MGGWVVLITKYTLHLNMEKRNLNRLLCMNI